MNYQTRHKDMNSQGYVGNQTFLVYLDDARYHLLELLGVYPEQVKLYNMDVFFLRHLKHPSELKIG